MMINIIIFCMITLIMGKKLKVFYVYFKVKNLTVKSVLDFFFKHFIFTKAVLANFFARKSKKCSLLTHV